MTVEYSVICFYRSGNRFKNTPCPHRHALVSVFGQIIGIHTMSGFLCMLVDDIVFLSTKGGIMEEKNIGEGSNGSKELKRKWEEWGVQKMKKSLKDNDLDMCSTVTDLTVTDVSSISQSSSQ